MTFHEQIKQFADVVLGRDTSPERLAAYRRLVESRRKGAGECCKFCGIPLADWMIKFRVKSQPRRQFCNSHHAILYRYHGPMVRGLAACLVALVSIVMAQTPLPNTNNIPSVALAWNYSTNPIVSGYNLYFGPKSGVYTNEINCGMTNYEAVYGLAQGFAYYFAATTYSATGAESAYSSEVIFTNYLYTITNEIFQVWEKTNLLLNVANPNWTTMFFRMSNGWLCASAKLIPANWSEITHFNFTNTMPLRATNIVQFKITP